MKNYFNNWIFNFIISLFWLWFNPIVLIVWLIFFTVFKKYYLKTLTWNSVIKTWLPILTLWYLILIMNLGKYYPIMIGPGYTEVLLAKASYDGIYCERICFSTILTLHAFSSFLGFPICIPIFFNIFALFWRTDCQGGDAAYRKPVYQHEFIDSEDGNRTTHNISTRLPFFGVTSICYSSDKKKDK